MAAPHGRSTWSLDLATFYWLEVTVAGTVALYAFTGALGDLLVPSLSGRRPTHLVGVAAWMAAAAAVTAAAAVALGGVDGFDPPRIRPEFRWAFRIAEVAALLAFGWHSFSPAPN